MNKCFIVSDATSIRMYDVVTTSAMKCAKAYGRCEGGEVITVYSPSGKPMSQVRWSQENGGFYYRAKVDPDFTTGH